MLSDVVATERAFEIGGRQWKVSMMGFLAFHAELELYIIQEMSERLAAMAASAPKEVAEMWYQKAYDQCKQGIPLYEAAMWTTSTSGFARAFWIAVRKQHPDSKFEHTREFLYGLDTEELGKARDVIEFAKGMEINPSQGASGSTPHNENGESQTTNPSTGRLLSGVS